MCKAWVCKPNCYVFNVMSEHLMLWHVLPSDLPVELMLSQLQV